MSWTSTRSRIGNTLKQDPNADVSELRAKMRSEWVEDRIAQLIAEAPPLTQEQRDRLAALLRSTVSCGRDAA